MEELCLRTEISCAKRGNKRFGNLLNVNFARKKINSPREHYTSFSLVTRKCCYLLGKLRKHFFVYLNDEIPSIFSNWEPSHSQNSRMLTTFSRSELPDKLVWFNLPTPEKRPKVHFALFLKTRISTNEAHVSSSFTASFHPFSLKLGKNVAQ